MACCIFSVPVCPLHRSLGHLSCNSGGIHSCGLFKRGLLLIGNSSQASQNFMQSHRPTTEGESVDGLVDRFSFYGSLYGVQVAVQQVYVVDMCVAV